MLAVQLCMPSSHYDATFSRAMSADFLRWLAMSVRLHASSLNCH